MPRIRKLKIDFISLVDQPANRKGVIIKSDDGADFTFQSNLRIVRKDAKKGLLCATVYEPNEVDTQGDWAEAPEIEDGAHDFMIRKRVAMVDLQHNYEPGYGNVVESFIKNGDDDRFPDTKNGSWCVVIKLSEIAKAHIEEIGGVSMAGGGQYDEDAPPPRKQVQPKKQVALIRSKSEATTPLARIRTYR